MDQGVIIRHKRGGRVPMLDRAKREILLKSIENGDKLQVAARLAGVAVPTVEEWVRRGEGRDSARPPTPFFVQLVEDIQAARARCHSRAMAAINLHMLSDWKAAAWFLENEDPAWRARLGPPPPPPQPALPTGPSIGNQTNVVVITREDLQDLGNQRLLKALTTPEPDDDARAGLVTVERG